MTCPIEEPSYDEIKKAIGKLKKKKAPGFQKPDEKTYTNKSINNTHLK